jgi:serine/threonine protein kinase
MASGSRSNRTGGGTTATTTSTGSTTITGVCDHVSDRYEKVGRVGEGTYGVVYKARDKHTGEYVALKRCLPHHESTDGFPLTTIRELHTLRTGQSHPNIVKLLNVAVSSTNNVFLVFEFCNHDVAQLLDTYYAQHGHSPFQEAHVKTLSRQLWSALHFLHERAIIHRDIKSSNLLYHNGSLKLADFGLARQYPDAAAARLTPNVVSMWYRAPELLWKMEETSATTTAAAAATSYTTAIDMWASGCVVAELILGVPLLDGKDEVEQMEKIVKCIGQPPPLMSHGPRIRVATEKTRSGMELTDRLMDHISEKGLRLLRSLLTYDPDGRFTAKKALESDFFLVKPLPATDMPTYFG